MNATPIIDAQTITVEEVFPHAPDVLWRALTTGALIARWMMEPRGFAAVEGTRFTFQTTPAGAWDGVIACEVLEVIPNRRFAYSWQAGDAGNDGGYGSRLDTVVAFTLTPTEAGTRLRLEHSGFALPGNEFAFRNLGGGWKQCMQRIADIASTSN